MSLWHIYVGTLTESLWWVTGTPSQGIERLVFNDEDGTIRWIETIPEVSNPQYLELHPKLPILYAAEFAHPGMLTDFEIRPDGALQRRSTTPTCGELAVAVSIHPDGKHGYVANWGDGTLAQFELDRTGAMSPAKPLLQLERRDPRPEADHPAQPHQIRPTPSGDRVLVAYAGIDELTTYAPDQDGALPSPPIERIEFPPGSGPRHIEFHPSGGTVYVIGELDSMLYVLEAQDGVPSRIIDAYPAAPPGYEGRPTPGRVGSGNSLSELDLHPDGVALYIGNRGSDCVTIVSLDEQGRVQKREHQPTLGRGPRAVRVDPTGRYLLAGNLDSCNLAVFRIEEDGRLQPTGTPVEVPSPSSIVFVEV